MFLCPDEIRKICEQNDKFDKEIEIIKKWQREFLELNNTINEMKGAIKCFSSGTDKAEVKICKFEDRSFEIT